MTKVEDQHIPVLPQEVLSAFNHFQTGSDLVFWDATVGRGGHLKLMFEKFPHIKALATDQDQAALDGAQLNLRSWIQQHNLTLQQGDFLTIARQSQQNFDGILADLGVSSPQLDQSERGFSFYHEGPLDMRMNRAQDFSAQDIIQSYGEKELNDLFHNKGDVHSPFRVVRAIMHDRKTKKFTTTTELSSLIERVDGWRKKGSHPATNYFLALRLEVNQELEILEAALPVMIERLKPGGILSVISFHSLEDRIVKNIFKASALGHVINKKVIIPTEEECSVNPRARSAKLRIFERAKV